MNFLLFDIDGTLINAAKAHLKAYQEAYRDVLGISPDDDILLRRFGQAEIEIHKGICEELNLSYEDSDLERIVRLWESRVTKSINSDSVKVLPGVIECLNYLKPKSLLGVITGNPRAVGEALLSAGNLTAYFSIKSYGDNAEQRADIIRRAVIQAKHNNYIFNNLIVIGDSPSDIKAGKSMNALTVGVATGYHSKEALEKYSPILALNSLTEYKKISDLFS